MVWPRPLPFLAGIVQLIIHISFVTSQNSPAPGGPDVYTFCDESRPNFVFISDSNPPFVIRSPSFAEGSYPNNSNCNFTLVAGFQPQVLSFDFRHFELEDEVACSYDSLCVNSARFCGDWAAGQVFQSILPEYNTFTLLFHTDYIVSWAGFEILVTPESAVDNQTVSQAEGIGSNQHNISYENITYHPGMNYIDRCSQQPDYSTPSEPTEEITTVFPESSTGSGDIVDVYTLCDGSLPVVSIDSSNSPFLIRSPNYGVGNYSNLQDCYFVIRSDNRPLVLSLSYNHFQLESEFSCRYDSLCVHGVRFCGNWLEQRTFEYILPEDSDFTLSFRTDGSVTGLGFEVLVIPEFTSGQSIQEVSGGVGSSASNIYNHSVTYYPGFPYTDRCALQPSTTYPTPESSYESTIQDNVDVYTLCDGSWPVVSINSSNSPFLIRSPNYGVGNYSNLQDCSFVIRSDNRPLVLSLSYNHFQLESEINCGYDSLCVHGVRFCGNWLEQRTFEYILPEDSDFTLSFRTDGSVTGLGFEVLVIPEFTSGQSIQEVSGGVGSSASNIYNHSVTYYPGFPYTDRCALQPSTTYPTPESSYESTIQDNVDVYTLCDGSWPVVSINSSNSPFLIRSPNYGVGNYSNLQDCSFVIRSDNRPLVLSLSYNHFQLESEINCGYDSLCVHGVRFCGNWLEQRTFEYILPEDSDFTLSFRTDGSVTGLGFEVLVIPEFTSGQSIQEVSGGVGSSASNIYNHSVTYYPGFPYTDRCALQPSTTYPTPESSYESTIQDNVDVYTLCDGSWPVVSINSSNSPFLIRSPNYGVGNYSNLQDCSFVIRSDNRPLVLSLSYNHFQLESEINCGYDSLCVHGVRFCGNWLEQRTFEYILPEDSDFTLSFRTDGSVTGLGFEILVVPEFTNGQSIQEVSGGVGSSASNIYNHSVTYYPGFPYTDRCALQPSTTYPTPESSDERTIQDDVNVYTLCDTPSSEVDIDAFSSPFLIRSPDFGVRNYSNSQYCSVVLSSASRPLVLSLSYNHFDLEFENNCHYDSLCVLGVKFCGNWLEGRTFHYILPENSEFTLSFHTDGSVTRRGFELRVAPEFASSQRIQQVSGGVGSSDRNIYNNSVVYYPGLPYTDRCAAILPPPPPTPGPTPQRTYYFCDHFSSEIVDIDASSSPVLIRSPNYGSGSYYNNQFCSLIIRSSAEPLILYVQYNSFDLEAHPTCSFDSLCVYGIKFCGNWETGRRYTYILPEYSSFTLVLRTDISVTRSGFEIQVSQEIATDQIITEAVNGTGSESFNILYERVAFQPGYPYTDRCITDDPPVADYPSSTETTGPLCYPSFIVDEFEAAIIQAVDGLLRARELLQRMN